MDWQELQDRMFSEMSDKSIFEKAQQHAFEYLDQVFDRPVFPKAEALDTLKVFDEEMPSNPGNATEVIDLLDRYGSPNTVSSIGGRYFGFVTGSSIPAGMAAKVLASYWDQNAALEVMSPITAKLERVVEKWLGQLFGLGDQVAAGFVSGTSMANFCGLVAARYRILQQQNWDVGEQGLFGAPKIRVVAGAHTHSSALKAVSLAGLGKANIEWVPVDEQGRIIAEQIPELDDSTILMLQAGNVNSGAFDPFDQICQKAKAAGAWIHIDGAFGLWAATSERLQYLTRGYEWADSWAVDGHKTLNTPYDSGVVLCRDQEALAAALHAGGAYLHPGTSREGMYYTPEMSKRSRVIEFWATLKYLGKKGVDQMIYAMHQNSRDLARALKETDGFDVLNDVVFNQVIVACENDQITTQVLAKIQDLRACWVGGSSWQGKKVIRVSICSWATTTRDIETTAQSFQRALRSVKHD